MSIREEIIKAIETLTEEELEAVIDCINFLREPEEVTPPKKSVRPWLEAEKNTIAANMLGGATS